MSLETSLAARTAAAAEIDAAVVTLNAAIAAFNTHGSDAWDAAMPVIAPQVPSSPGLHERIKGSQSLAAVISNVIDTSIDLDLLFAEPPGTTASLASTAAADAAYILNLVAVWS